MSSNDDWLFEGPPPMPPGLGEPLARAEIDASVHGILNGDHSESVMVSSDKPPVDIWNDMTTDFDICHREEGHDGDHDWHSRFAPQSLDDLCSPRCRMYRRVK
jgi:hypothetical protein